MDQNLQTAATISSLGLDKRQTSGDKGDNGDKKVGPIISTLVIVLILIIAALYIFASRVNQPTLPTDETTNETAAGSVQPIAGTSTSLQSLQNDLSSSTDGLDNQNF